MSYESIKMPRYKSNKGDKTVYALKIDRIISKNDEGAVIVPEDTNYGQFKVSTHYVKNNEPKEGGYYILHQGGHSTWQSAKIFEKNYTLQTKTIEFGPPTTQTQEPTP